MIINQIQFVNENDVSHFGSIQDNFDILCVCFKRIVQTYFNLKLKKKNVLLGF